MILDRPTGDPAEFKIKRDILFNGLMLKSEIESHANMNDEVDEIGRIWLKIFWNIRIWVESSNEEAVTYSRDFNSVISGCENMDKDLIQIKQLLYYTFMKVQADFEKELPLLPALKSHDMEITAAQIMELFVDREMY